MYPLSESIHDSGSPSPAGAYSRLDELIRLRYGARELKLNRQRKAFRLLVGPHQAKFRSRGIEFEEVRGYQAGDDVRGIDWRVTARTGKAHTRVFREERERPVLILVDQRLSMFFGSRTCFKSVMAAHVAALLAWAALQQGDRVGGLVFNSMEHREIRPKRNVKNVLRFLNDINSLNHLLRKDFPAAGLGLDDALEEMRRITRPGSNLFVISDFKGLAAKGEKQLYHLSRHGDVSAVRVFDPLEQELPANGCYSITDGNERFMMYTGDKDLRRSYRDEFNRKTERLVQLLGPMGIPLIPLSTQDSPAHYFRNLLGRER
jgi:uncharacterized protein (DUF58 family)